MSVTLYHTHFPTFANDIATERSGGRLRIADVAQPVRLIPKPELSPRRIPPKTAVRRAREVDAIAFLRKTRTIGTLRCGGRREIERPPISALALPRQFPLPARLLSVERALDSPVMGDTHVASFAPVLRERPYPRQGRCNRKKNSRNHAPAALICRSKSRSPRIFVCETTSSSAS